MRHKRREAPEWVFSWRPRRDAFLPRLLAIALTACLFALLLTSVRIRVTPAVAWSARKAAVIQVGDDAEGRALTLRAREGGPFPSRFEPSAWEGIAVIERAALEAARWQPPPYQPQLRDLPDGSLTPPLRLAAAGEPVFPKRPPVAAVTPAIENTATTPVLHPLSGISPDLMPRELPPFDGVVAPATMAEPWRFLLRLDAAGGVLDCVSLAGGDENGPSPLESWLRRVAFPPDPKKPTRWIAVGVGFTNHPVKPPADGIKPR